MPVRGTTGPDRRAVDGPWATECADRSSAGIIVVAGMFVPADDGRVTNTLIATGPGQSMRRYDKIHLYDAFGFTESRTVAPGREPVVISVDGVARRADRVL